MHPFKTLSTRRIAVVAALAIPVALSSPLAGCKTPPSEERIAKADEYLKHNQYEKAGEAAAPIVADDPGNWKAQYAYGRAMLGQGKLEEARRSLDRAYRLKPNDDGVVTAFAECMAKQKDVKDAYQLLRSYGAEFRSWRAYMALSTIAEQSGDPDTAVTAVNDAIKVNEPMPGALPSIEPYMRAADLAFRFGKEPQGVRRLRQAYGIIPGDPRIVEALKAHNIAINKDTALPIGP